MNTGENKIKSFQDIVKRRQGAEFIGRDEQIARFRHNLELSIEDDERLYIFNIHGPAGVGKTWLVRRLVEITKSKGITAGYSDESESDVLEVMRQLSELLKVQGVELKTFDERLRTYRQKRQELESDPKAPKGTLDFILRSVAKTGVRLAERTLVGGVILDITGKDTLVTETAEWGAYLAGKLTNKDELSLVKEPIETLTPLFISDLDQRANGRTISLFFDTYERTGVFLDNWLRDILEGHYGQLPADLVITIAGQYELDRNRWSPYSGVTLRLPIEPFSEAETREYLIHKSVIDEGVIELILQLSGGLPLLVGTLASGSPHEVGEVVDPHEVAVARFLKWVDDSGDRRTALDCALARFINKDVVHVLTGREKAEEAFEWLKGRSFVTERPAGRVYHQVVRDQMLRHVRRDSPRDWGELHGRLAEYYEKLRTGYEIGGGTTVDDATWQTYALEAVYHRLCQSPLEHITAALDQFLAIPSSENAFARRWAEAIFQAGRDAENSEVESWGDLLIKGLVSREEGRHLDAAVMFTELIDSKRLGASSQASAYHRRGSLLRAANEERAIMDFAEATALDPLVSLYWFDLAGVYWLAENHEKAGAAYTKAVETDPTNYRALTLRGWSRQQLGRFDEALSDYSKALELSPNDQNAAYVLEMRARLYLHLDQYDESLADFDRMDKLGKVSAETFSLRGEAHLLSGRPAEALEAFSRAIELDPDHARNYAGRAEALRRLRQPKEALPDLYQALTLEPENTTSLLVRALVLYELDRSEEALADFAQVLKLKPNDVDTIYHRGLTLFNLKRYEEATKDFTDVINLSPGHRLAKLLRGEAYLWVDQYDEAIADFTSVLSKLPGDVPALIGRGRAFRNLGRFDEALSDLNSAVDLNPGNSMPLIDRGLTRQQSGELNAALNDFDQALIIKPGNAQAIAMRAETLRFLDRDEEALAELNRALDIAPEDAQIIASRAESYRCLGRLEEAKAEYARAFKLDRNDELIQAILARGVAFRTLGRYEEAIETLNLILEADPLNAKLLEVRGDTYIISKRFEEAVADYSKALELSPDDSRLLAKRGEAYRQADRYDEALIELNRSLNIDPNYATALTSRGLALQMLKRFNEALCDLNRAIELKPGDPLVLGARGLLHEQMGNMEQALVDLNRSIEINPNDGQVFAVRGETYMFQGQYEKALSDLDHSIELGWTGRRFDPLREFVGMLVDLNKTLERDTANGEALFNRANLLIGLKRYIDALDDINRLCELYPDDLSFQAVRGDLYRRLDRSEDAVIELTNVIKSGLRNSEAYSMRGKAYMLLERFEDAAADFDQILQLESGNVQALINRGTARLYLGQLEEALSDLTKAIERAPDKEVAFYNRGLVYQAMDRHAEASADFERAPKFRGDFATTDSTGVIIAKMSEDEHNKE